MANWMETFIKDGAFIEINTVNSEIFLRVLFLGIALKDKFATLKIRDYGMIYLHQ